MTIEELQALIPSLVAEVREVGSDSEGILVYWTQLLSLDDQHEALDFIGKCVAVFISNHLQSGPIQLCSVSFMHGVALGRRLGLKQAEELP